jgi:hypothetical protein
MSVDTVAVPRGHGLPLAVMARERRTLARVGPNDDPGDAWSDLSSTPPCTMRGVYDRDVTAGPQQGPA